MKKLVIADELLAKLGLTAKRKSSFIKAGVVAAGVALSFTACNDDGINGSINGNVTEIQAPSVIDIHGVEIGKMGFYLIGGDGNVYENTRISLAAASGNNDKQPANIQRRPNLIPRCLGAGSGCLPEIVVEEERPPQPPIVVMRAFDEAIKADTVDLFFDEANRHRYELIFDLTERDLFYLRNRVITFAKEVKSENSFTYEIIFRDDHNKIYE